MNEGCKDSESFEAMLSFNENVSASLSLYELVSLKQTQDECCAYTVFSRNQADWDEFLLFDQIVFHRGFPRGLCPYNRYEHIAGCAGGYESLLVTCKAMSRLDRSGGAGPLIGSNHNTCLFRSYAILEILIRASDM